MATLSYASLAQFAHRRTAPTDGRLPANGSEDYMPEDETVERRSKPRIKFPIPATVRSTNTYGELFEIKTVLDDLSIGGLHLRLRHRLNVAASLFAAIRFAGVEIEADGIVKRIEPQPDGSFGFAVAFESYRIFGLRYDQ